MSTIEANTSKVENIEHSTAGSVTTDNVVRGTAKAWIAWVYSSNAPPDRD